MVYRKVVAYCEKKNISICEFEKLCGIGNGVVGAWKDDKSKPTLNTLEKIAKATNTSITRWLK